VGQNSNITHLVNDRFPWIDIAKALLIICLVFFHMKTILIGSCGLKCQDFERIYRMSDFWIPFFMQAFFVITGYCSNFNKPFVSFLTNNIKTLLVPMLTLNIVPCILSHNIHAFDGFFQWGYWQWGLSFWFIPCLFLAKLMYYVLNRCVKQQWILAAICVAMAYAGTWLAHVDIIPEFWCWRSALAMLVCLWFGRYLKGNERMDSILLWGSAIYLLLMIAYSVIGKRTTMLGMGFGFDVPFVPMYLLLALSGSCLVLQISKWIGKCTVLEYIGRGSLLVYCCHWMIGQHFGKYLAMLFLPDTLMKVVAFYVISVIITILLCCVFIKFYQLKYVRWSIGKW